MQLPYSDELNIGYLSRLFDNTTNCYKFFWFQAILRKLDGVHFKFTFDELINEMIADAWYMVTEYHLRLGPLGITDNLEEAVKYIHENYGFISSEKREKILHEVKLFYTRMINRWVTDEKDRLTVFDRNGPYLATKKIGKNNPKAEQIEKDNKLRMDWNREVDRAIISEVSMDDILQIKKKHITEPIKRSIELCGNKPQRLALILNMAITELVLLISRVLETARAIRNKILHTDVPKTDKTDFASNIVVDNTDNTSAIEESIKVENKITTQEESIKEVNVTEPDKPVMTPETAAYPKLKKIKVELDNQNNLIFQAEQQRGNLEIELSDLKGLAKITRKAELQRKIDEKTYYINRLKIGLSNMVRNYGFENMNEFYLSYKESKSAYAEYQQKTEDWKKSFGNTDNSMDKAETMSEKLARLQKEADSYRQYNRRMSNKLR